MAKGLQWQHVAGQCGGGNTSSLEPHSPDEQPEGCYAYSRVAVVCSVRAICKNDDQVYFVLFL